MAKYNAILVVDMGNSSTKINVLTKGAKEKSYREKVFELPNEFAQVEKDYVVSTDYTPDTSCIFAIDSIQKDDGSVLAAGHYCAGLLRENEFSDNKIRPSATVKKYRLDSTYLSARLMFLYATQAVAELHNQTNIESMDITWKVVTLLPPGQISTGAKIMENLFKSITSVEYIFPQVTLPVNIDEVKVLAEGYCAYLATVFDKGHKFRNEYKSLIDENVIIFDIGAGTTDCLVVKKNTLVQNSKFTIDKGGNNVRGLVKYSLSEEDIIIDDIELDQGLITGYIKDGTTKVDISDYINKAREIIANSLVAGFQNFAETYDIKVRSIGYILICGGGSISNADNTKIVPLSEKMVQNFKALAPNSKLIATPKNTVKTTDAEGNETTVEEEISPKFLNLVGASIAAETLNFS